MPGSPERPVKLCRIQETACKPLETVGTFADQKDPRRVLEHQVVVAAQELRAKACEEKPAERFPVNRDDTGEVALRSSPNNTGPDPLPVANAGLDPIT